MDKLIKGIPPEHIDALEAKCRASGVSVSARVRQLIKQDAGVTDLVLKDVPAAMVTGLMIKAAAAGKTLENYITEL